MPLRAHLAGMGTGPVLAHGRREDVAASGGNASGSSAGTGGGELNAPLLGSERITPMNRANAP